MTKSKILIAGAGPVGLAGAVELTRLGHEVKIIDPMLTRQPFSKAIGVNSRTLDILEASGLSERIIEHGRRVHGVRVSSPQKKLFEVGFETITHRFNFMTALAQCDTEQLLEDRLKELGIAVERGQRLTDFEQTPESISVKINTEENHHVEWKGDYLIGADGAHSTVRKLLHLDFKGHTQTQPWHLAEIYLDESLLTDKSLQWANLYRSGKEFVFYLPVRKNLLRIVSDNKDLLAVLPPAIEEARTGEVAWSTEFTISHRQVSQYQVGRTFLAGDAAHIHSPVGGRGMNMGIEDVAFLARCIDEDKIDWYHRWRHKIGQQTVRLVHAQTRAVGTHNVLLDFAYSNMVPMLLRFPLIRKAFAERQLGLHTPFLPPGF